MAKANFRGTLLQEKLKMQVKQQQPMSPWQQMLVAQYGQQIGQQGSQAQEGQPTPTPSPVQPEVSRLTTLEKPPPAYLKRIKMTSSGPTEEYYKNPEFELWETRQKEQRKMEQEKEMTGIKIKGKRMEERQKKAGHFSQAIAMFKGIVSQVKGAEEEQQGLGLGPGIRGAIAEKTKGILAEPLGIKGVGRISSAYGQRVETALRLNSILTGQNRVIRSVINMVMKSLPDRFDTPEMVSAKIAQSVTNSYKITKAFEKAGLTTEELNKMSQDGLDTIDANQLISQYTLTPEENQELETIIQDVLGAEVAPVRTLVGPRGEGIETKEPKSYKSLWE